MFSDFGQELPAPTVFVLGVSAFTQKYFLLILASISYNFV